MKEKIRQFAEEYYTPENPCGYKQEFFKFLLENPLNFGEFIDINFNNANPIMIEPIVVKVTNIDDEMIYRMFSFKSKKDLFVSIPIIFTKESSEQYDDEPSYVQEFINGFKKYLICEPFDLIGDEQMNVFIKHNRSLQSDISKFAEKCINPTMLNCGCDYDFFTFLIRNHIEPGMFVNIHFCNADPIDIEPSLVTVTEFDPKKMYLMFIFKDNIRIPMIFDRCDDDKDCGEETFVDEFKRALSDFLSDDPNNFYDMTLQ